MNVACKYYFLIAILKGEQRRFEPRPHLKASRQTQLKVFYYLLLTMSSSMVLWLQCWLPVQVAQVQRTKQNQKGDAERFSIYIFSIRNEANI
jgi:hypothetical protein